MKNELPEKPELRNIDLFPAEVEGQQAICLQDPEGITEETLVLTRQAAPIITALDGTRTLSDIIEHVRDQGGQISRDELEQFLKELNKNYFLLGPQFEQKKQDVIETFENQKNREPSTAGEVYPEEKDECETFLGDLFREHAEESREYSFTREDLSGFISPHIDLHRGKKTYARTFQPLVNKLPEDALYVIFGTSHAPMNNYLCPTRKHYTTPVGTVETDQQVAEELWNQLPGNRQEDLLRHKTEHSIEFPVLFLNYLLDGGETGAKILPILCSSFTHPETREITSPQDTEKGNEEFQVLKETLSGVDRDIVYIAAADFAHVGQRFGDREQTTEGKLEWVEEEDRASLEYCREMDPEGFLKHVSRNDEQRRICGLAPIFYTLQLLDDETSTGELTEYRQAVDLDTETTVSFAGMIFHRNKSCSST